MSNCRFIKMRCGYFSLALINLAQIVMHFGPFQKVIHLFCRMVIIVTTSKESYYSKIKEIILKKSWKISTGRFLLLSILLHMKKKRQKSPAYYNLEKFSTSAYSDPRPPSFREIRVRVGVCCWNIFYKSFSCVSFKSNL